MRWLAIGMSKWHLLNIVIALAEQDAHLRHALFGAVSGHHMYREIMLGMLDARWLARMTILLAGLPFKPKGAKVVAKS